MIHSDWESQYVSGYIRSMRKKLMLSYFIKRKIWDNTFTEPFHAPTKRERLNFTKLKMSNTLIKSYFNISKLLTRPLEHEVYANMYPPMIMKNNTILF